MSNQDMRSFRSRETVAPLRMGWAQRAKSAAGASYAAVAGAVGELWTVWRGAGVRLARALPGLTDGLSALHAKLSASPKLKSALQALQRQPADANRTSLPVPSGLTHSPKGVQPGLAMLRSQFPKSLKLTPSPKEFQRGLSSVYEAVAFDTLRALWRDRLLILSFVAVGLLVALVASFLAERRYTAEALIHLDFGREDIAARTKGPPSASMDAAVLVESEARLIRSHGMARRVVTRLKLDENPSYTSRGLLTRLLSVVNTSDAELSNVDRAARVLARQLAVSNDTRSYLISIAVTSNVPAQSAKLANAFAVEYLNDRIVQRLREAEAGARNALAEATVVYGERHPALIQARASLAGATEQLLAQERLTAERPDQITSVPGLSLIKAEPVSLPSGPSLVSIFGICLLGSMFAGVALVVLLERTDNGFRTEVSVPAETGLRCVGMIPSSADCMSAKRTLEQREAFRSLRLAVGLAGQSIASRVVMVASAVPGQGTKSVVNGLADSLKEDGRRVLIVDTTPSSHLGVGASIDDVLGDPELMRQFLAERSNQPISELRRASGLNGTFNPFASFAAVERNLGKLLADARDQYDVIILDTPPTMLYADSVFFGRFADISLLVADWKETPRAIVMEAVRRLREGMVRVDGIVLAEVDLGEYPSYSVSDRTYYLSQYSNRS